MAIWGLVDRYLQKTFQFTVVYELLRRCVNHKSLILLLCVRIVFGLTVYLNCNRVAVNVQNKQANNSQTAEDFLTNVTPLLDMVQALRMYIYLLYKNEAHA